MRFPLIFLRGVDKLDIIILIVSILLMCWAIYVAIHAHKENIEIDKKNQLLAVTNQELEKQYNKNQLLIQAQEEKLAELKEEQLDVANSTGAIYEHIQKVCEKAFENYVEVLDNNYKTKEEEYEQYEENLNHSYSNLQLKLMRESDEIREELEKIRATRAAAIEANLREKEIENNISFYCLEISDADKADIAKLESLKPSLNKPRVLSMLIWQTWFMKPLKALSANVIGTNDKTGIYKITNIKTKECYIGQAVSIKDRWVDHVKCGLGIDTPAANKLYKAMQDYGLWNFSFEVLEECPRDQLNEKEAYYIDLYQSYEYGFNSNKGVTKK